MSEQPHNQNQTTRIVRCGYDKKLSYVIRSMTFAEVLQAEGRINVLDKNGDLRLVKVNGAIKTWKSRPGDCRLPYKYGMYEFGYIEFMNEALAPTSPEPVVIVTDTE